MAVKRQKNLRMDDGILSEFEKICKKKKMDQNAIMEDLMKQFIARDGQMLFDDLYAPRISHAVKTAVDDQINRLAKMIYKTQIDATAALYSTPILHNQLLHGMEDIMDMYLDPRIMNQNRTRISEQYTFNLNGKNAVRNFRNIAITDHKEQKKEGANQS